MIGGDTSRGAAPLPEPEVRAYTDGASTGSRGPGGYGAVISWKGKTEEVSGGEQDTTNLRMEVIAACVALETIDDGHIVTVYSDSSYLVNCMRRGWYEKWRENGWLTHRKEPVANKDLWERLLEATQRHQEVRWRKVKGHSKADGVHKTGNDRADELAVTAKKEASGHRRSGSASPGSVRARDLPRKLPKDLRRAEALPEDLRRDIVLCEERASGLPDG
jgi:ribonuclease HI